MKEVLHMRPLLTFLEVADILNCSKPTVERHVYEGAIPSIKIRRATRFHVADIEDFIAEQKSATKGGANDEVKSAC